MSEKAYLQVVRIETASQAVQLIAALDDLLAHQNFQGMTNAEKDMALKFVLDMRKGNG